MSHVPHSIWSTRLWPTSELYPSKPLHPPSLIPTHMQHPSPQADSFRSPNCCPLRTSGSIFVHHHHHWNHSPHHLHYTSFYSSLIPTHPPSPIPHPPSHLSAHVHLPQLHCALGGGGPSRHVVRNVGTRTHADEDAPDVAHMRRGARCRLLEATQISSCVWCTHELYYFPFWSFDFINNLTI